MTSFNVGDRVKFSARGKVLTGVVISRRIQRRRGRAKNLAALFGDPSSLDREVVEIRTDDGLWTVSVDNIESVEGKARLKDVEEGKQFKSKITRSRQDRTLGRRERNVAVVEENDLRSLRDGDEIEVQYRGGYWKKHTFRGFTGSGQVRFVDGYSQNDPLGDLFPDRRKERIRFSSPKFVRKPVR